MKHFSFEKRDDWRKWLAKNHAAEQRGVWLDFYRKGTGRPTLQYEESVEEALCFGWIDSIIKKIDEQRYCRKFTPRRPGSVWSSANKRRVARLISSKKMTRPGLAVVEEAKRSGGWETAPASATKLELPAELSEALRGNKKARRHFDELASSYRRHFVGWVATARRAETRARRARESVALLEQGKKLGLK
jgi:uncharacterized protein YdeI (YjbR/CyaY-like superfamily)